LHPQALGQLLEKHLISPREERVPQPAPPPVCANEVRHALHDGQFQPYYQPKVDLLSGAVCGVEVLVRWNHPFRGLLSPVAFLPELERAGLLDSLLFTQIDQALTLQRQAREQGFAVNVAFNLHAQQLANPQLVPTIRGILALQGTPGSSLTFELTESGLLEAPATSLESLVRLRMMGCQLSIDDFGAGFSSLQRLCQLPFNEIKLDAEFVRTFEDQPRCRAVISSTLALGEALGMSVVIEGVETEQQRQQLLDLGCTQAQGYLFARPMSGPDLLRWLQASALAQQKT
jgi:EAL domain-containing protein (putative c-di-GMP-specific phosphodiesterase class I)